MFKAFSGRYIPLSPFLDFCENPWFDQGASGNHNTITATFLHIGPIILRRKAVPPTEDGDGWHWAISDKGKREEGQGNLG
jgi:hypothetical protein